jgi:GAF domain-containing protein
MNRTDPFVPAPDRASSDHWAGTGGSDLQESLDDLALLVTGSLGLADVLSRVAGFATHAIPGADGVGVTLLAQDREGDPVQTLAASDPFVEEVDEIQYVVVHEGPCITATRERRTVRSGSLGGERMWPRFGPRAGRLGVHSALSLPLLVSGDVVGAINVYARSRAAFDERAEHLGELFAVPAAVAVRNAQVLDRAQTLALQLQEALSSRSVIDQAIGILRGRTGGTAQEAFDLLRTTSQKEQTKLADVASRLVVETVRRAQARHLPR